MRTNKAPPEDLLKVIEQLPENTVKWKTYDCKLVTPMYGGGVKAGEVDMQMPIRASSIRGQLRFWWRLLQRRQGGMDSAAMFKAEAAIWGGIGGDGPTASKVTVKIVNFDMLSCEPAFEFRHDNRPGKEGQYRPMPEPANWTESYSLFSAQQGQLSDDKRTVQQAPKKLALPGLSFKLAILFDKKLSECQRTEVEAALRWWASFGGVGARTRRGVGAVLVESIEPVSAEEVQDCGGILKLLTAVPDAQQAWKKSVSRLKDFRQGLDIGRNHPAPGSQSPAGRSRWPEADTIKSLSNRACAQHSVRLVQGDVFPRAAFGLPIVFHFKDRGDPADHILEPANVSSTEKYDRMASPLILRPYWNGSAWQPAALLLPGWRDALTQQLKLKFKGQKNYTPDHWPADTTRRKELAQAIKPMQGRGDDPLTAFMKFFVEKK